jgi:hypothetical protein
MQYRENFSHALLLIGSNKRTQTMNIFDKYITGIDDDRYTYESIRELQCNWSILPVTPLISIAAAEAFATSTTTSTADTL